MKSIRSRAFGLMVSVLVLGSVAQASLEPRWIEADANHDGKTDVVALTNLADIAFDAQTGDVVGWFYKTVKGTDISQPRAGGFLGLGGGQVAPYKSDASIVGASSAVVLDAGKPLQGEIKAQTPVTSRTPDNNNTDLLEASFKYTQGAASVEKHYSLNPRRLTLNLGIKVNGLNRPGLEFVGFDQANPIKKILEVGGSKPLEVGSVKRLEYAAAMGDWAHALIVQPLENKELPAKLEVRRDNKKIADGSTREFDHAVITVDLPRDGNTKFRVFGGPNELVRLNLEQYYPQLPEIFTPNLFGQLSLGLMGILQFIQRFIPSWGWTIIVFTLLLRLILWPLLHSQLRSSAEMQAIQPMVAQLREKFKDDPAKLNAETMKLYQEHKVNPAAGCLPLLVQMPILIVLWRVFANFEFDQGFWWLRDLALPDNWFILPILYVAVNAAQTYYYTKNNPEMFRQQMLIQLVFVYLTLQFPSGVTLYYVLSTMIQVAQQYLINKSLGVTPSMPAMPSFNPAKNNTKTVTVSEKPATDKKKKG